MYRRVDPQFRARLGHQFGRKYWETPCFGHGFRFLNYISIIITTTIIIIIIVVIVIIIAIIIVIIIVIIAIIIIIIVIVIIGLIGWMCVDL